MTQRRVEIPEELIREFQDVNRALAAKVGETPIDSRDIREIRDDNIRLSKIRDGI